ncbi:MAG: alanine racemase [Chloroflexaceae bacterium]|nr:alanine racemase [Chloroflexaceae bacterium]
MPNRERPTWIELDYTAAAHNIRRLCAIAGVPVMAVVKANAYGHGAVPFAHTALAHGATMLAVATVGEARMLREAAITAPIMILGYTPPWQAAEAVALGLTCAVYDMDVARALAEAATAQGRSVAVHVKVDTGMNRLGISTLAPDDAGTFLRALSDLPGLSVEGLFTHFATADEANERYARVQLARFRALLKAVTAAGLRPPIVHAANSAATLRFPDARFDMVRPGIAGYGLHASPDTPLPADFRPVLTLHTELAQVKPVPADMPLSYGCTFVTRRPSVIATLPVGYADGVRRVPPWREVLLHGRRAPIVGRICMDYLMIDITEIAADLPVQRGDTVTLIGAQVDPRTGHQERITAEEVAGWLGTINYEVTSGLMARVPRVGQGAIKAPA